ncbi:MAG: hypothetical protein AB1668_03380 [Nanoarchaeota archaeon]
MLEEKISSLKRISTLGLASLVLSGCEGSYGCLDDGDCVVKGSEYECTLNGRFYAHPTEVNVSEGQVIVGQASGLVNWWEDRSHYDNGPDNVPNFTRGLYLGISTITYFGYDPGMHIEYAGSSFSLEAWGSGQIYFMIPDGPGNGICTGGGTYWSDNDGEFLVRFHLQ